jgi:predicted RNase H-like HicB family nuclease
MNLTIETEREDDGLWIAEVPQLPGVLAYGTTPDEAMAKTEVLALRVLAERLEHGQAKPMQVNIEVAGRVERSATQHPRAEPAMLGRGPRDPCPNLRSPTRDA